MCIFTPLPPKFVGVAVLRLLFVHLRIFHVLIEIYVLSIGTLPTYIQYVKGSQITRARPSGGGA